MLFATQATFIAVVSVAAAVRGQRGYNSPPAEFGGFSNIVAAGLSDFNFYEGSDADFAGMTEFTKIENSSLKV
jgi:hypothetical protein